MVWSKNNKKKRSTNQGGTPNSNKYDTLGKHWFSPLQMRMSEMISETVLIFKTEEQIIQPIFCLNHRYRGFIDL